MSEKKNVGNAWRSALDMVVDEKRRQLGPHLSDDELVAYHAGELEAASADRVQDHLVLCPRCAGLLLELDAFAADAATVPSSPAATVPSSPAATVVPIAERRAPRRRWWLAAAAAVAASVLLVVWPRGGPLPEYALLLEGGVSATRSVAGSEAAMVVVAGRPLTVKLQPATAVAEPVTARAYLRRGAELRPLSAATLEVGVTGVITLSGIVGSDLQLPLGDSELVMAVGFPGALPARQRLQSELGGGAGTAPDKVLRGRRWIGLRQEIRVIEPAADPAADAPVTGVPVTDLPVTDRLSTDPWIEYAGCRAVEAGPICLLPEDRLLTVWVGHTEPGDVRIDGGSSQHRTAVQNGHRYQVEVSPWATELVVEVRRQERPSIWVLELSRAPIPDWYTEALQLYRGGEGDKARGLLESVAAGPDASAVGSALSFLARIERQSGEVEHGEALYRRAIDAHRLAGRLSDQIKDACGLAYHLIEERRFTEARQLLESLPVDATGGSARELYFAAYYRGLLAEETGDLRAAMHGMRRAVREAQRAGLNREHIFAVDLLARQFHTVGLTDAAADLHSRVQHEMENLCLGDGRAAELTTCDCARLRISRGWTGLLSLEAGQPAGDPTPLLADAERSLERAAAVGETCIFPEDLPNARLNLALAALHSGDPAKARRHLDQVDVDAKELPRQALWQLDVEARVALADSRPEQALALYRELGKRADVSSSPEAAWRAAFGSGIALESMGNSLEASEACDRAESLLEQESLLIPLHLGRARFLAQRELATRFCLDLRLHQRRDAGALAVVRRSAARALRHLRMSARIADLPAADRQRWEQVAGSYRATRDALEGLATEIQAGLPRDQERQLEAEIQDMRQDLLAQLDQIALLAGSPTTAWVPSPPAPGTLLLAYHPLPRGWAAIAADASGVTVRRIAELDREPELDAERLSALLLEPFADRIERAKMVQFVPYGALRAVDFHALPFGDDVLLRQVPIAYRLDLPEPPAAGEAPSLALVVSGPGLLAAPGEAREVRRALESRPGGWRVELLEDDSVANVRRWLRDAALFHYAGHANFDDDSRGWDSHLALAAGTRLTVDDVLSLPRVPRWVVLSGCETGRDSPGVPLPNVGLAQAFLVAGTEAVLAATADVSDADAAALTRAFYRHWQAPAPFAAALRKAQLELRDQTPESDWSRFRILTR